MSLKERSMINLAMISALNRPHELKLHIRGALRNGLSREQIREILRRSPKPTWRQPVNDWLFETAARSTAIRGARRRL
ncbi:Carboxymuconolactone decarboxylase family protein [compost metagenome]